MNDLLPSRLVALVVIALSLAGVSAWFTMPRQEDPSLPARWGRVSVLFPGADAETVERLVVDVVERHLAEVDELHRIESRAIPGVGVLELELRPDVADIDNAWDRVQTAVTHARAEFSEGVGEPAFDRDVNDQDAMVVVISGSDDLLELREAAQQARQRLLTAGDVAQVRLFGDPGEQITVAWDEAATQRLGTTPAEVAKHLSSRHLNPVAGSIAIGERTATVRASTEFESVEDLRETPVALGSGVTVPLAALAEVHRTVAEPPQQRVRIDGRAAIALGVVLRRGVDVVSSGQRVRRRVDQIAQQLDPLSVEVMFYQPDNVRGRLADLGTSLLMGMAIVVLVLVTAMGPRLGLVVGAIVPLVAASALALFAASGGVLHQVSIAAFVISLGILVDNGIVVTESIQARIDAGVHPTRASKDAVRELLLPLGAATGTTVCAFVPMLFARGSTAEFTRDLPVVLLLTLTLSYGFALVVAPSVGRHLLRPRLKRSRRILEQLSRTVGVTAWRHHKVVLALTGLVVAAAASAGVLVESRFFPRSDRPVVVVDVALPEGSRLMAVERVTAQLEQHLAVHPGAGRISTFVGRGAPHFYYNLPEWPHSPHRAQMVIETTAGVDIDSVVGFVRSQAGAPWLEGAEVLPSRLQQGPPVAAPIEIRLRNGSLEELVAAADVVRHVVAEAPGTADVRVDASLGGPVLQFEIDETLAASLRRSPEQVALALRGQTQGVEVGHLRTGSEPVPIVVRGPTAEYTTPAQLMAASVAGPGGTTPLSQLGTVRPRWLPTLIRHRDRERTLSVLAEVEPGASTSRIVADVREKLASAEIPGAVEVAFGGEVEEASHANEALMRAAPLGVVALLGFLVATFNSMRRVFIVLVTIPLAVAGIVPGLLLGGQPFGFMALLGVLALVGVVVNNAIVLIDQIERLRRGGLTAAMAVPQAVMSRTRPILLTTGTTVAGLVPLAVSSSSLWPPLAWSMMTGLVASTGLTLLATPALYRALCSD